MEWNMITMHLIHNRVNEYAENKDRLAAWSIANPKPCRPACCPSGETGIKKSKEK